RPGVDARVTEGRGKEEQFHDDPDRSWFVRLVATVGRVFDFFALTCVESVGHVHYVADLAPAGGVIVHHRLVPVGFGEDGDLFIPGSVSADAFVGLPVEWAPREEHDVLGSMFQGRLRITHVSLVPRRPPDAMAGKRNLPSVGASRIGAWLVPQIVSSGSTAK